MDSLDRLGWAAGMSVEAYGLRIGIRVNTDDPRIVDDLRTLLPPGSTPCLESSVDALYSLIVGRPTRDPYGRRQFHLLYLNATRVARSMDWEDVRERLKLGARIVVAHNAPHIFFVVAGVVAYRGRAIVVVGLDQDTRTALVVALTKRGCTYLSSAYAVIRNHEPLVLPFPNTPAIRREPHTPAIELPIEAVGGSVELNPLPIGLVVAARVGARWRHREVSRGRALLALLAHTVGVRDAADHAIRAERPTLCDTRALEVTVGDVDDAADRLLAHMAWRSSQRTPPAVHEVPA
jgi:hypothetical protein